MECLDSPPLFSEKGCFEELLEILQISIERFPENRRKSGNYSYTLHDITLGSFSVFFSQSPSFLSHQRILYKNHHDSNAHTLFHLEKIPTDPQIKSVLDQIASSHLNGVFTDCFHLLNEIGVLENYRQLNGTLLIGMDGTEYFTSDKLSCPGCLTREKKTKDGAITEYHHRVLAPMIMSPHSSQVIPMWPEFISNTDGEDKQDCENKAFKRWLETHKGSFNPYAVTFLGDDLYSKDPLCKAIIEAKQYFIFTCKHSSHPWLSECVKYGDVQEIEKTEYVNNKKQKAVYRYVGDVDIKDDRQALKVNWLSVEIQDAGGKRLYRNDFVTNHEITNENVPYIAASGRCRWKIENEGFNTLKTRGYHFEHNFGHGKQNLSETLLTLNLIAFLFHSILEWTSPKYKTLRQTLPTRKMFYTDFTALTRYMIFDSWDHLISFMIQGLKQRLRAPPVRRK